MIVDIRGVIACSRYSFAPNSLHYCGPERQNDMLGYVTGSLADDGLVEILNRFETLYPYLVLIASENTIADPFDYRVVEAYWLGNTLLDRVRVKPFAAHLADRVGLKRKIKANAYTPMMDHLAPSGIPQHTFHVLNIFIRTGHHAISHTLHTMDECRISWGRVIDTGKQCLVSVRPLIYERDRLRLGKPEKRTVTSVMVTPKVGDWVSIHWGFVCDILTLKQRMHLAYYTEKAVSSANSSPIHRI